MEDVEQRVLSSYVGSRLLFWKRYVDDICTAIGLQFWYSISRVSFHFLSILFIPSAIPTFCLFFFITSSFNMQISNTCRELHARDVHVTRNMHVLLVHNMHAVESFAIVACNLLLHKHLISINLTTQKFPYL